MKTCPICGANVAAQKKNQQTCGRECGHILTGRKRKSNLSKRFWSKVETRASNKCWPWMGSRTATGYGQFWNEGKMRKASRVAYELETGLNPGRLHVLHRCDNPPCCNPAHLFTGTHRDNMDDMNQKGRQVRGVKCASSKLDDSKVAEIRAKYSPRKVTQKMLAAEYGISSRIVFDVIHRRWWQHVT